MTEIQLPEQAPQAVSQHVGQATAIEQSRAIAEVQGAIVVAQQVPRNMALALAQLRESCEQKALAERAFFRYSRGTGQITGPSIHLAREVARCFGNLQYGLTELSRNDAHGESQMQAWAWDVQTNTRASTTFIVKHIRDTKQGAKPLTDVRDIYENNANMGARRLREQIFAVVPAWFTEEAKSIAAATLEKDTSGKTLAQRIADLLDWFAGKFGVTQDQLEQKQGRPMAQWTVQDLAVLHVVGTSLGRGEVTVDDEFPTIRVTADEVRKQREPEVKDAVRTSDPGDIPANDIPADVTPDAEPDWAAIEAEQEAERQRQLDAEMNGDNDVPPPAAPEMISRRQMPMLQAMLSGFGVGPAQRHAVVGKILSRRIGSMNDLTKDEAITTINTLEQMGTDTFRAEFADVMV